MDKLSVREVILVEGKYDKAAVSQVADALILTTDGFGVFQDTQRANLFRRLAQDRGVVILTDPDGGGKVIRGHLKSILPPDKVKEAFVPDIPGKEKRKPRPGKEGKLGVEGMKPEVIRQALIRAGVGREKPPARFTKTTMFVLGLSGTTDAAHRRKALQKALELPENLSSNNLLAILNATSTPEEVESLLAELTTGGEADA